MSSIFLSLEVSVFLFVEILLLCTVLIAFYYTIIILLHYDKTDRSELQYTLEKKSYLVGVIVFIALVTKIVLLPFFLYTLNELTAIIPGAMCGAGVIGSNVYGEPLLLLKIAIVFLASLWILLNIEEQRDVARTLFREKLWFFGAIFTLLVIEIILEFFFLLNISTQNSVLCCSSIYNESAESTAWILHIPNVGLVFTFYALLLLTLGSNYKKYRVLNILLTLLLSYVSYYAIVYFFGTYIYELPTHTCPFCLFQMEYNYIGYFIFGSLFIASFYSISSSLFIFTRENHTKAIWWYLLFVIIASYSFLLYIIKNKVFL